jgi:hypothetical protein
MHRVGERLRRISPEERLIIVSPLNLMRINVVRSSGARSKRGTWSHTTNLV